MVNPIKWLDNKMSGANAEPKDEDAALPPTQQDVPGGSETDTQTETPPPTPENQESAEQKLDKAFDNLAKLATSIVEAGATKNTNDEPDRATYIKPGEKNRQEDVKSIQEGLVALGKLSEEQVLASNGTYDKATEDAFNSLVGMYAFQLSKTDQNGAEVKKKTEIEDLDALINKGEVATVIPNGTIGPIYMQVLHKALSEKKAVDSSLNYTAQLDSEKTKSANSNLFVIKEGLNVKSADEFSKGVNPNGTQRDEGARQEIQNYQPSPVHGGEAAIRELQSLTTSPEELQTASVASNLEALTISLTFTKALNDAEKRRVNETILDAAESDPRLTDAKTEWQNPSGTTTNANSVLKVSLPKEPDSNGAANPSKTTPAGDGSTAPVGGNGEPALAPPPAPQGR